MTTDGRDGDAAAGENPGDPASSVVDFLQPWAARVTALHQTQRRLLEHADINHARGPVRLCEDLSAEELEQPAFLANAVLLLRRLVESEQRATAKGNLNRSFVLDMAAQMRMPRRYQEMQPYIKVTREADVRPLEQLRVALQVAGLMRKYRGAFRITRRGAELSAEGAEGLLMVHLFRTFFGAYNLYYLDHPDDDPTVQAHFPLYLWMISRLTDGWLDVRTLRELAVSQSDPERLAFERRHAERVPSSYVLERAWWSFERRVLAPLEDFGLLESRADPEVADDRMRRHSELRQVRKTPLFDRFVRFELPTEFQDGSTDVATDPDSTWFEAVAAPTEVARLKVTLRDVRPPIWRRMEVPLSFSFRNLSDAIVAAFAWSNTHLHDFEIGKRGEPGERCIGMPDEMDLGLRFYGPPVEDDRTVMLGEGLRSGQRLVYEYDFGDGWRMDVLVEAVAPADPGIRYPRVTHGRRAGPPEDCGGVWGYEDILAAFAGGGFCDEGADHESAAGRLARLREHYPYFAPEEFDLAAVNEWVWNAEGYWE